MDTTEQLDVDILDTIVEPEETNATKSMTEDLEAVILFIDFSERKVYIVLGLAPELRSKLIEVLRTNANYFAWSHAYMTSILPEVITHKLSIDPRHPLVEQIKVKLSQYGTK